MSDIKENIEESVEKVIHPKKKNIWKYTTGLLTIILLIFLLGKIQIAPDTMPTGKILTPNEAGEKAIEYINEYILSTSTAKLVSTEKDNSGVYKIELEIQGSTFDSYVTPDGKLLFPEVIDLEETPEVSDTQEQPQENIPKTNKPKVELFVMSFCPYGTQAEKGIIPVVETLADKIDFSVKFVYYAMHGETELHEQMLQYCIQKEQNEKYIDYLSCFLKEGNSNECVTEVGVDKAKLDSCIENTDNEYKIMENFNDQSTWLSGQYPLFDVDKELNEQYGVGGSPTLIVNGKMVSSGRDPASLLKTICSGFSTQPEECNTELSSQTPSAGFGFETTGTSGGSCG